MSCTMEDDIRHDIVPQKKKVLKSLLNFNNKLKNIPTIKPLIQKQIA